jgi:hypothetical protein
MYVEVECCVNDVMVDGVVDVDVDVDVDADVGVDVVGLTASDESGDAEILSSGGGEPVCKYHSSPREIEAKSSFRIASPS